jgi:hypothetical protein
MSKPSQAAPEFLVLALLDFRGFLFGKSNEF